jgi:hypothetical protein
MSALVGELFFTCLPVIVTAATALPPSTMNTGTSTVARATTSGTSLITTLIFVRTAVSREMCENWANGDSG